MEVSIARRHEQAHARSEATDRLRQAVVQSVIQRLGGVYQRGVPIKQNADLVRRQLFHQSVLAQAGFNERKQIPEIGHNNIGLVWVLGRCGKNLR
jgi:hypothetical protein